MRKILISFIMVFSFYSCVFATGFNVGIYNLDNDLGFDLKGFCSNFFQYKFDISLKEIQYQDDLDLYRNTISKNNKVKESYAKNTKIEIKNLPESKKEDYKKINFIELKYVENCDSYFIKGDKVLLKQLCLDENLSLIIIPKTVMVSGFIRYRIFVYNNLEDSFSLVYDRLITKNQLELEEDDLLNNLLPVFYDEYCLVSILGENLNLTLVTPGNYIIHDNLVILPSGEYKIENYSFSIKKEKNLEISIEGKKEVAENILMNSKIGNLELLVNNYLQFKTPFKLDEIEVPYTIKVTKKGFKDSIMEVSDNSSNFEFDLSPSWIVTQNKFEESRKEFYNSFALSIGLFALRVVSKSLKEDNFKLYSGIDSFIYGVSIINLLNVANKLFIYYKSSAFLAP